MPQVADGLVSYFDKTLVSRLLYTSEWPQAEQALAGGRKPSTVYGAEHLLRLFVKLPELLAQTSLRPDQGPFLSSCLNDALRYIAAFHSSTLLHPKDKYVQRAAALQAAGDAAAAPLPAVGLPPSAVTPSTATPEALQ